MAALNNRSGSGRSRFHGRGVSPTRPNKKRLVGGLCGETGG